MDISRVTEITEETCRARGWGNPRFIAAGNSGAVFATSHPTHGEVALKMYDPAFFDGENAEIEVRRVLLQEQLHAHGNPHLIDVLEVGQVAHVETWFMLMELCQWPTLADCVNQLPDEQVQPLLRQLVMAVTFLDDQRLIHRDIKPANIAVSSDFRQLKLLDLGVLRRVDPIDGNGTDEDATKRRFVATVQYSPPEYITRREPDGATGFAALNLYQVGAVLHDMIMKRPLFCEEVRYTESLYAL
jgi:serine/threonine protein kinase